MENLLTTAQLGNRLGIKESTLRAWVFQKRIPCVRVGRLVRFREGEIERWLIEVGRTNDVKKA